MKFRTFVAVGVCTTGLGSLVIADDQSASKQKPKPALPKVQIEVGDREERNDQNQNSDHGLNQRRDHALATCLAIENQGEVAIAKFAQSKSGNSNVKEFAGMLVKEHTSFLQKLSQYAPEATRDGYLTDEASTDSTGSRRTDDAARKSDVTIKVQPSPASPKASNNKIQQTGATDRDDDREMAQPIDFLQLHKEIAQECLTESKEKLSKKNGNEFDECFIGHQIAMHGAMKDKLVVFQRHASGELGQLIAAGIESTEKHMKKAEEIMKQLADSSGSKSKSKSTSDTTK